MKPLVLVGSVMLATFCGRSSMRTIMDIQGSGPRSPFDGQIVETSGVVTYLAVGGESFFLQDPVGDRDPSTSDGIVVDTESVLGEMPLPSVGDLVRITGEVREHQRGKALPRTELTGLTLLEIQSSRNRLPSPVELVDLPDRRITDGIEFWEPLEGMRVTVGGGRVVSPPSRFREFAILTALDAKPGSGFFPEIQQILLRDLGANEVDYNPERILVAAGAGDDLEDILPGDRVRRVTGVVDYTFGNYKVRPSLIEIDRRKRPEPPLSRRSGPAGDTVVTTFNLENLFDLDNDPYKDDESSTPSPDELETKLRKLASALGEELLLPDIVVAQEVENTAILQELADRVNRVNGTGYVATSLGSTDGRGIEVGFLWDRERIELQEAFLLSGPEVERAFGAQSPSPGREPLVGVFKIEDKELTIVGNHFKSKGGDDPLFGENQPPLRETELARKAQARAVRSFVSNILDEDPEAWVLVAGDLNDFPFGEPGEGSDHPLAILEGHPGEVPLSNLTLQEDPHEAFTFVYQGNSQILDHLLASPALSAHVVAVDILHFNASFPHAWTEDETTSLRSSDHDAVEARFVLRK